MIRRVTIILFAVISFIGSWQIQAQTSKGHSPKNKSTKTAPSPNLNLSVLGIKPGITTQSQAMILLKRVSEPFNVDEYTVAINTPIKFGGIEWGVTYVSFYNGKVAELYLVNIYPESGIDALLEEYDIVAKKYLSQYKHLKINTNQDDAFFAIQGRRDILKVEASKIDEGYDLRLHYLDITLSFELFKNR